MISDLALRVLRLSLLNSHRIKAEPYPGPVGNLCVRNGSRITLLIATANLPDYTGRFYPDQDRHHWGTRITIPVELLPTEREAGSEYVCFLFNKSSTNAYSFKRSVLKHADYSTVEFGVIMLDVGYCKFYDFSRFLARNFHEESLQEAIKDLDL